MLVGHGHATATLQFAPYYVYQDGPAFRYGTTGFFEFQRLPGGWVCPQAAGPRDTAKDVWPLFTANGATLKVRTDRPDPMNVTSDSVTITNDLPENFYDGRVRFVLPKGSYSVTNGLCIAQYDFAEQRARRCWSGSTFRQWGRLGWPCGARWITSVLRGGKTLVELR